MPNPAPSGKALTGSLAASVSIPALSERQKQGRYKLAEIADILSKLAGENYGLISKKLTMAVHHRILPVYLPGQTIRYDYDEYGPAGSCVRVDHEEVYWEDVNKWLAAEHPRVKYRFPSPDTYIRPGPIRSEQDERAHQVATALPTAITPADANNSSAKPPMQQRFQEMEILRELKDAGFDPKALPARPAGKSGPKAAVRLKLPFSRSVFDKAWERLRGCGEIRDVK